MGACFSPAYRVPTTLPLPVVLKTFFKHTKRKGLKLKDGDSSEQAWDDIFYDE